MEEGHPSSGPQSKLFSSVIKKPAIARLQNPSLGPPSFPCFIVPSRKSIVLVRSAPNPVRLLISKQQRLTRTSPFPHASPKGS